MRDHYTKASLGFALLMALAHQHSAAQTAPAPTTPPAPTTAPVTAAPTPEPGRPRFDIPIHGKGSYADSPDGKVYYETEGAGPAVFLIPGGPGGAHASYHPWFSRLAKDHTVVYMDNIGRGRSDRLKDPKRYTVPRDAEDVEAVRKALGVDGITVLGHSYGGMVAEAYAMKYAQHVSHLVLSDTLYNAASFQANIDSANWNEEHQFPEVWAKLMEMRRKGVKSSAEEYEDLYGSGMGDMYWYNPDNEEKMFFGTGDPGDRFNFDIYLAMIGDDPEWKVGGTMKGYDPSDALSKLRVPTLICVGRYDRVAMPKVASEMHALIPTSRLEVFEKSGHRPWVEESDRYFTILQSFLNEK